jgi:DNA polymerase III epsilon subunit-like protein
MDIEELVATGAYVAVDIEGDGGLPRQGPLEIALVRYEAGVAVHADVWIVNPGRPIDPYVTRLHGIGDGDVADLPGFDAIEAEVRAVLDGCVLVGHALVSDMEMLGEVMPDVWELPAVMYDSRKLARSLGGLEKSNLDAVAEAFGIDVEVGGARGGRHTAERDARVSGDIFAKLSTMLPRKPKHRRSLVDQATVRKPGRLLKLEEGGPTP